MVRKEVIFKTPKGMEYIRGFKKAIFENGVVISAEETDKRLEDGTLDDVVQQTAQFDGDHSGYDYAYCMTTGYIRKKARKNSVHERPTAAVEPVEEQETEPMPECEEPEVTEVVKNRNWFDWAYPKIMLILPVICSVLSVYFTGVYMERLLPKLIAYFISTCMLLYGLVGTQMARRAWVKKHFFRALIYGVTSFCTIGFSMYTAVDVNYEKYVSSHSIIVEAEEKHENNNLEFELLTSELNDNKEQIDKLSKTYVVMWDGEKKTNVVVEGKITEKAQNRINELTERNNAINQRLIELAHEGTKTEKSDTEKAKSLTDLIGAILGVSGNIVQMIILLLPGVFIDLVNVLSITIYNDRFEDDDKNADRTVKA